MSASEEEIPPRRRSRRDLWNRGPSRLGNLIRGLRSLPGCCLFFPAVGMVLVGLFAGGLAVDELRAEGFLLHLLGAATFAWMVAWASVALLAFWAGFSAMVADGMEASPGDRPDRKVVDRLLEEHPERSARGPDPPSSLEGLGLGVDPHRPSFAHVVGCFFPQMTLVAVVGLFVAGSGTRYEGAAILVATALVVGALGVMRLLLKSRQRAFERRALPVLGVVHHVSEQKVSAELEGWIHQTVSYAYLNGGLMGHDRFTFNRGDYDYPLADPYEVGDGVWVLVEPDAPLVHVTWRGVHPPVRNAEAARPPTEPTEAAEPDETVPKVTTSWEPTSESTNDSERDPASLPEEESGIRSTGTMTVEVQPGQRCPFCHEGLAGVAAGQLSSCNACRATFHRECIREANSCTTPGCKNRRQRR